MKKIVVVFLFICLINTPISTAQVVNIEGQRFVTDKDGWKGDYNLGFTFGKQAEKFFAFSNTAHAQYKTKNHLIILLGNVDILKSSKDNIVNTGFFHFRHNFKIKDWLRWEEFTQIQYNKLNGIRLRYLLGTGPRFKVVQLERFKTYIGTLYMLEYEINTNKTQKIWQGRFSGYLSFSLRPIKAVEIISTTYYQPRIDKTKDYRISSENALDFKITKVLTFGLNFGLNYDSRPPEGAVTKLTYKFENKIKVNF